MRNQVFILLGMLALLASCKNDKDSADAYGNFIAREILISSELAGKIVGINATEGDVLKKGAELLRIDSTQQYLITQELQAKNKAISAKKLGVLANAKVLQTQKQVAEKELLRLQKLFSDGAATQKQIDDLTGKIQVLDAQINAALSNLSALDAELRALQATLLRAKDNIAKTKVRLMQDATILERYVDLGEVVAPGKTLFKAADLNQMELKAYVSGEQLSSIRIGKQVEVKVDGKADAYIDYNGTISWIASNAEFTPKNIQTKEVRQSLVYAIKIVVDNDGALKINMPAEVYFISE